MKKLNELLKSIDGKTYGSYRRLNGIYNISGFKFSFLHIQGDPYAPPSRARMQIDLKTLDIPEELYNTQDSKIALADFLLRKANIAINNHSDSVGTGKGGLLQMLSPGQEVIEQNGVSIKNGTIEARLAIGLPGDGRRVMANKTVEILLQKIPDAFTDAFFWMNIDENELRKHIELYKEQQAIRQLLKEKNLVAFIADKSILPRESGVSNLPLTTALPFETPNSMKVKLNVGNKIFTGMGIKKGISIISGGGFHGKSTLLKAIESGIYNHIIGDGREYVISCDSTFKVRAEDGRKVCGTNIHPLIQNLPESKSTISFDSDNASGSTSQASNMIEALETDSKLVLIDEDISAVNFLIRDTRMRQLIESKNEPVIPLVDRIKDLEKHYDCSFILVIGACGDYLPLADNVIAMSNYKALDYTEKAKTICTTGSELTPLDIPPIKTEDTFEIGQSINWNELKKTLIHHQAGKSPKVRVKDNYQVEIGPLSSDLSRLEQVSSIAQCRAIAYAILTLILQDNSKDESLKDAIAKLDNNINKNGVNFLKDSGNSDLIRPRILEITSAMLRLRS